MKTKCLLLGLVLSMLIPAMSFAHAPIEPILVKTKMIAAEKLHVRLANLQQEMTTVRLETLQGEMLYSQNVRKHNGYTIALDIADLPNGRYLLRVSQVDTEVQQVIVKDEYGIKLSNISQLQS